METARRVHTPHPSERPEGTTYEAREGARGANAVRRENCQVAGNSGGGAELESAEYGAADSSAMLSNATNATASATIATGLSSLTLYLPEASAQHGDPSGGLLPGALSELLGQQSSLDKKPARSTRQSDVAGTHSTNNTTATTLLSHCTLPGYESSRNIQQIVLRKSLWLRGIGRRTNFFWHPVLPHKCGVPLGYGTRHLCGSEEFCRSPS